MLWNWWQNFWTNSVYKFFSTKVLSEFCLQVLPSKDLSEFELRRDKIQPKLRFKTSQNFFSSIKLTTKIVDKKNHRKCKWRSVFGRRPIRFPFLCLSLFKGYFYISSSASKAVSESPPNHPKCVKFSMNEVFISVFSNKPSWDLFYALFAIISWRFVLKYNKCEWMK